MRLLLAQVTGGADVAVRSSAGLGEGKARPLPATAGWMDQELPVMT